ncbi:MAG: glycoside hydrolase family 15 protein [Chloroflexi bacterium]|nr:glycoside hydrolase family 15 protein [Chloroflexota bacterium]
MENLPIADYALLSDCRSAALVSRGGSVDWLCAPRFDAGSVFSRLLDRVAGHWSIHPVDAASVSRRYLPETMVLETIFRTATGTLRLVDAMALGMGERGHDLGLASPGALVRQGTCLEGTLEVEMEFAPRPEYGIVHPLLAPVEGGLIARGGADVLVLSLPTPIAIDRSTARVRLAMTAGQTIGFALRHCSSWEPTAGTWDQDQIAASLEDTIAGWRSWSAIHQQYEGPWRDQVHHSGRVLQALSFRPTGAIVAAPTTSLPESVGGERNWDYRYTWVRDASLTLQALWVAACPDEAELFFGWMANAVAGQLEQGMDLQIMFGIGGEHDLSERSLQHLAGWRGSRPVRVGNGAWDQRQLDVYGELLGAARLLADHLGGLLPSARRFLVQAAEAAAARWREPDQGIWEVRGGPRDFLYSKLMCWAALDCAISLADQLGAAERAAAWTSTREEIRQAILERGWSERAGAFTQSFGSDDLDASALMMPIVGFLPGDDPRMRATIDAIADRLTDERGLVYRYRAHDGLAGDEGTFLLCTFWLAQAQALAGELSRARATFERAIAYANDVGLLAEEVDPGNGELLGNFPQAFSHIGLINAAWAIAQAEASTAETIETAGGRIGRAS